MGKLNKCALRRSQFRSGFEFRFATHLQELGIAFVYEPVDKRITYYKDVKAGRCEVCHSNIVTTKRIYLPDFYLPDYDMYIETKGRFKSADRTKHLSIQKCHPDIDLRFIFMRDNRLTPRSPTNYSTWCEEHGFKWAIKTLPIEWVEKEAS